MIREISENDLNGLLKLYTQLHNNPYPDNDSRAISVWKDIINDKNHHIIVMEENGAIIENVITDIEHRKKGYATACLDFAKELALQENCYKIMLMTGS